MMKTVELAQRVFTKLPPYAIGLGMIEQATGMSHVDTRSAVDYLLEIDAVKIETCTCKNTKHFYYQKTDGAVIVME